MKFLAIMWSTYQFAFRFVDDNDEIREEFITFLKLERVRADDSKQHHTIRLWFITGWFAGAGI